MFVVLNQVYYWISKSNTHNNYNYIIKIKWNYFILMSDRVSKEFERKHQMFEFRVEKVS
jgi:hypothetical protein